MKRKKMFRAARFWLPVILVAGWWGTPLFSQEKPKTVLLQQKSGIQYANTDRPTPAPLAPAWGLKSEKAALAWSLGATVAIPAIGGLLALNHSDDDWTSGGGTLLFFAGFGIMVGPSFGYFYAGKPGRGLGGIGTRLAIGVGALAMGIQAGEADAANGGDDWDAIETSLYIGGGLMTISAIYDIVKVKDAVRKHNRTLPDNALTITPAYFAGHCAPGLEMRFKF